MCKTAKHLFTVMEETNRLALNVGWDDELEDNADIALKMYNEHVNSCKRCKNGISPTSPRTYMWIRENPYYEWGYMGNDI